MKNDDRELNIINNNSLHKEHIQAGKVARKMAARELVDMALFGIGNQHELQRKQLAKKQ